MSMLDILQNGKSGMKNAKFADIAKSMKWRQKYLGAEIYPITLDDGRTLNFKQVENGEINGFGTGAVVWPAAHVLSKYMEIRYKSKENGMGGMRVCDIGSGTGCTGFVAAALGATESVLTDQECIFFLMEDNKRRVCQENLSIDPAKISLQLYDWGESPSHFSPPFDLVIISDCILPKLYPIEPLVEAVAAVMGPDSIALFSYEHRNWHKFDPRYEFERLAGLHGLCKTVIPYSDHHPEYRCDDIEIWEVRQICPVIPGAIGTLSTQTNSSANCLRMLSWGSVPEVQVSTHRGVVTVKQDMNGTIGCLLWPSSVILSRYLLSDKFIPPIVSTKQPVAIDLGSGCGLTAIALMMRGFKVIATDIARVLPTLTCNLDSFANAFEFTGSATVLELSWTGEKTPVEGPGSIIALQTEIRRWSDDGYADLIICSDCCYNSSMIQPLMETLSVLMTDKTVLLMANELRSAFDDFLRVARAFPTCSLDFEDITLSREELEVYQGPFSGENHPSRPVRVLSARKRSV